MNTIYEIKALNSTSSIPTSIVWSGSNAYFVETKQSLKPERVIYNGLTTIVFWKDGTKILVRCSEEDPYDRERAVASAIAYKIFGSKNQFKKFVSNGYESMTVEEEFDRQREKALKKLEK